jgi:pilus assembly protein Flp/PilA
MLKVYLHINNWLKREEGQDLAEYALLIGLIALALVGGVTYLGGGIDATFRAIGDTVTNWAVPAGP